MPKIAHITCYETAFIPKIMKKIEKILAECEAIKGKPYFEDIHEEIIKICKSCLKKDIEIEKAKDKIYDMCCDVLDTGDYDNLTMHISLMVIPKRKVAPAVS